MGSRGRALVVAVVVALTVAGLVTWLASGGDRWRTASSVAVDPVEAGPASDVRAPVDVARTTEAGATREPAEAAVVDGRVLVRGRCVDDRGRPLTGALATISRDEVSPFGWPDPEVARERSGDDGRFLLAFEVQEPGAYRFEVRPLGHETRRMGWDELAPGSTVDLGDLVFHGLATVTGRVVDSSGVPRSGERWFVRATAGAGLPVAVRTDPATGAFVLRGVEPGETTVRAFRQDPRRPGATSWSEPEGEATEPWTGELAAGDTREVVLVFAGPRPSDEVVVVARGEVPVDATKVTLESRFGEVSTGRASADGDAIVFAGLSAEPYLLRIADPAFVSVEHADVWPGDRVEVTLVGVAIIEVAVLDRTGARVEAFRATVHREGAERTWRELELWPSRDASAPGALRNDRLVPGDYVVRVEQDGGGPHEVRVEDLGPGEQRFVEVRLEPRGAVLGRVTDLAGAALAAVEVVLAPSDRSYRSVVATRADGRFRFPEVAPGEYRLQATRGPVVSTPLDVVVAGTADVDAGELRVGAPGVLAARVLGLGASAVGAPVVVLEPIDAPSAAEVVEAWGRRVLDRHGALDAGGTTRVELSPGLWRAALGERTPRDPWNPRGVVTLGEVRIAAGETTEVTWDLGATSPGRVDVEVLGVRDPRGLEFSLSGEGGAYAGVWPSWSSIGLVAPGTYELTVSSLGNLWSHVHPTPVVVRPSERAVVSVELSTASGTPRFVDESSGAPAAPDALEWGHAARDGTWSWAPLALDGDGRARVHAPVDVYRVRRRALGEEPAGSWVEIRWTADGPALATTSVPR